MGLVQYLQFTLFMVGVEGVPTPMDMVVTLITIHIIILHLDPGRFYFELVFKMLSIILIRLKYAIGV